MFDRNDFERENGSVSADSADISAETAVNTSKTEAELLVSVGKKRGPKPGTRHAGMFKPGNSGYAVQRGKAKVLRDLSAKHSDSAEEAMSFLFKLMRDKKEHSRTRLAASVEILDRVKGKAISGSDMRIVTGEMSLKDTRQPAQLSDAELLKIINAEAMSATLTDGKLAESKQQQVIEVQNCE
jgi:hypothetical protein